MTTADHFTMALVLCDDKGTCDLSTLNRLRGLGGHEPYKGAPFACTGSAHLAGEHIRCTSPAHELVIGKPLNGWQVSTCGHTSVSPGHTSVSPS